jgi:hypothetical protein
VTIFFIISQSLCDLRKLNTEPSIGASHQVSVHLAKQLQRRRFLEIDQSDKRMACGGHFINGWELNAHLDNLMNTHLPDADDTFVYNLIKNF